MFALICLVIVFCLLAYILREKTVLLFIAIRPAIDYWRDIVILQNGNFALNLNAALAVLLLAWAGIYALKNRQKIASAPAWQWLALTLIIAFISALYSVSRLFTLIEAIKLTDAAALFLIGFLFVKDRKITIRQLLCATAVSAVVPILAGLFQLFSEGGMATFGLRGRIYGTFAHPNVFAFFTMALILLLAQFSVFDPLKFWQSRPWLKTASFAMLGGLLLMTYTRAALIGLLVFLVVIGVIKYRRMLAWLASAIALFYLIFYPLNTIFIHKFNYSLQSNPVLERLTKRSDEDDSFSWRVSLIRETMPLILSKPILGYGFGAFPIVWEANRSAARLYDDSAESHNDYLRLLLEIGIIGLAVYLIFFASLFTKIVQRMKTLACQENHLMLLGWVCAFVVVSVSDNMLHHTAVVWLTWLWWGAILGSYQKQCASPNFLPLTEKKGAWYN